MTPVVNMDGGGVLGRMFPHRMKLKYTCSYMEGTTLLDQHEVKQTVVLDDVLCSVQNATAVNGEFVQTDYVILSPCLDFSGIESARIPGAHEQYELEVTMNGRTYQASGIEIVEVDNRETHEVEGVKIGCCIKVKLSAARWLFGK